MRTLLVIVAVVIGLASLVACIVLIDTYDNATLGISVLVGGALQALIFAALGVILGKLEGLEEVEYYEEDEYEGIQPSTSPSVEP